MELSRNDVAHEVQVGDSVLFSVVPGWTFVGVIEHLGETSVSLAPASWVETLVDQNTISHLQYAKDPTKVAERAWGMEKAVIPYQGVCWFAKMKGDARAFSIAVEALKKSR